MSKPDQVKPSVICVHCGDEAALRADLRHIMAGHMDRLGTYKRLYEERDRLKRENRQQAAEKAEKQSLIDLLAAQTNRQAAEIADLRARLREAEPKIAIADTALRWWVLEAKESEAATIAASEEWERLKDLLAKHGEGS